MFHTCCISAVVENSELCK